MRKYEDEMSPRFRSKYSDALSHYVWILSRIELKLLYRCWNSWSWCRENSWWAQNNWGSLSKGNELTCLKDGE